LMILRSARGDTHVMNSNIAIGSLPTLQIALGI
jgi:hypothetical protein